MKKFSKISFLLFLIIFLPTIVFTVFQFNSMNQTEREFENIYKKRLSALINTINLRSEEFIDANKDRFIQKLNSLSLTDLKTDYATNKDFFEDIFVFNPASYENSFTFIRKSSSLSVESLNNFLTQHSEIIERLERYSSNQYYKNEPIIYNDEYLALLFIIPENEKYSIGCFLLKTDEFIKSILSVQINDSPEEKFLFTVISPKNKVVYSNDSVITETDYQYDIWLLPGYKAGVSLKDVSIKNLISARLYSYIFLTLVLNIIIIAGGIFLFRNIKKQLEFAQMRTDFVSNVSHELRTPLALISMFAETLELNRVKTEEKKQEYYTIISKEASRLSRIVNKILNFSKMEAGRREYHKNTVSINKIINDVIATYSFHLKNKKFEYKLNLNENVPNILADEEAIAECLINLIDNAIKYSEENKKIIISTYQKENKVLLSVKDFGIGIAEKDKKKIFEKFFRVSTGLIHKTKGTGLGLALVVNIMNAHKGEIKLESKPGNGSNFILVFPGEKNE